MQSGFYNVVFVDVSKFLYCFTRRFNHRAFDKNMLHNIDCVILIQYLPFIVGGIAFNYQFEFIIKFHIQDGMLI